MPTRTLALAALLAAAACGGGGSSTSQPPPPPTPAQLGFAVQPTSATSSAPIAPALKVEIRDASGARVAGSTAAVTLAIAAGPAGATLAGTTTVAAVDGVATFGDLAIARAGGGYALAATSGTLTAATSATFAISAGPAAALAFAVQPSSSTGGSLLPSAVAVELRDAAGNLTTSTATVSLALLGGAAGATLTGTASVPAAAGVATFPGLSVDRAGTGYQLRATAPTLPAADSAAFDVAVGPPTGLAFAVQPSDTRSTVPSSPAIAVDIVDAGGNAVAGATNAVSLEIASGPAVARLTGGASVAAVAGRATFGAAAVDAAGSYTLRARSAGLADAVSTTFAATDAWTPMGPDGGYIQRVAVHPATPARPDPRLLG